MRALVAYCTDRPVLADVLDIVGEQPEAVPVVAVPQVTGYVYLAKSGRHFKIGQQRA